MSRAKIVEEAKAFLDIANAATPGPWGRVQSGNQWGIFPADRKGKPRNGKFTDDICMGSVLAENVDADTVFIIASRNNAAAIISRLLDDMEGGE